MGKAGCDLACLHGLWEGGRWALLAYWTIRASGPFGGCHAAGEEFLARPALVAQAFEVIDIKGRVEESRGESATVLGL